MKKLVLLLVASAFAAAPAVAATKHTKSKETLEAESIVTQHDNTKRLPVDLVSMVLPTWSLPIYFNMQQDKKKPEKKKK